VALVRTDVSEELSASFIRVTIGELATTLAVNNNRCTKRSVRRLLVTASVVASSPILVTLMNEAPSSSETSVLTRAMPEDTILRKQIQFRNRYVFYLLGNLETTKAIYPLVLYVTNFHQNPFDSSRVLRPKPRNMKTAQSKIETNH
jgi:hypothetical protein